MRDRILMSCASLLASSFREDGGPNERSAASAVSNYFAAVSLSAARDERKSTSRAKFWMAMFMGGLPIGC